MKNIIISIVLCLCSPLLQASGALELPELGDSSSTSLTPEHARQIGGEIVRRMRQGGYVINDPLISSYVGQLGRSLSTHADSTEQFTFFVVDAPSINAFALPGGYIGVHSGLILASQTESELASVLAHEIAHVTQHHLARSVEQANRMQLPMTLALLAAILLGGGDADVVNAAVAASLGGTEQMKLNFSRAHEHEADRVGMQMLAQSDYDPRGMAGFFTRLLEEYRYSGMGAPEFLSTHPVTTTRLAEAQSAAAQYPYKMRSDTTDYQVAKAKLRLHHSKSAKSLMAELTGDRAATQKLDDELYLEAITHNALHDNHKAENLLKQLLQKTPESIAYRETLGRLYYSEGRFQEAVELYAQGLRQYPSNELLTLSLAANQIASKQYTAARQQLQETIRHNHRSAQAYSLLAQLESEEGNQTAAHLAQARYYLILEDPHSAREQLTIAKKSSANDFYLASRIEALSKEIDESLAASASVSQN